MDVLTVPLDALKSNVNARFIGKEPWQIVSITTTTVLLSVWFYNLIFDDEPLVSRSKKTFFKLLKKIPAIRNKIDTELKKVEEDFKKEVELRTGQLNYKTSLPEKGLSKEEILSIVDETSDLGRFNWKTGRVSGAVYSSNEEIGDLVTAVYGRTAYGNLLHPDVFPGLCKMEAEVVKMALKLFNGDSNSCGTMTTGGTESILMACKAYRDYAREIKAIKKPEIVIPVSMHCAFDKAAQYFGLKVKTIPIDPKTFKVDVNAMKRAISSNTVMLGGSAPNFPYGTIDDIDKISDLGLKYNIPVHVDSCLGGFLTAFMERAGYQVPVCDFRLKGVTSISADTHKYGYAPKGTSLIMYRDVKYLHHQYTVTTDWPGGVYGSPTVAGSRAGGIVATCWATMLNIGHDGYVQITKDIIDTTRYIENGLRKFKELTICGTPATSVIAFRSDVFHIYRLVDALTAKGWHLNTLQYPPGVHICVTRMHTQPGVAETFLEDVADALREIMKNPDESVKGKLALYGSAQELPDRSIVGDFIRCFIDALYYTPKGK